MYEYIFEVQHSTWCEDSCYSSLVPIATYEALWLPSLKQLKHSLWKYACVSNLYCIGEVLTSPS